MIRAAFYILIASLVVTASDTGPLRDVPASKKDRVAEAVVEKSDLDARIARLERFLDSRRGHAIGWREQDAIRNQINLMRPYSEALRMRIDGYWER